jgi:hypothetical protein
VEAGGQHDQQPHSPTVAAAATRPVTASQRLTRPVRQMASDSAATSAGGLIESALPADNQGNDCPRRH